MRLRLVHLYPDLLGTYGDRGNVICLQKRAAWRGIDVAVDGVLRGQPVPADPDLIFIGGGQDRLQQLAARELGDIGPEIAAATQDGAVVFAVCGGYQLVGTAYRTEDAEMPGLGLLDIWTEARTDRIVGNAAVRAELGDASGVIVGFENHSGRTYLGAEARALGRVVSGRGNNGEDGTEGAVQGNVIGTYLHGPVLPRNAWLTDALLSLALARHGMPALGPLDDTLENSAHARGVKLARRRRGRVRAARRSNAPPVGGPR